MVRRANAEGQTGTNTTTVSAGHGNGSAGSAPPAAPPATRATRTVSGGPLAPARRPLVLLVEDELALRQLVTTALRAAGYKVVAAADGQAALEALDCLYPEQPDAILLDLDLPRLDGREFAARYRRRFRSPAPLIVFSASVDAELEATHLQAAASVGKPFDLHALESCVASVVAARVAHANPRQEPGPPRPVA
jgi:CheY-like chemotaxis protein